jgi:hypothetical protein
MTQPATGFREILPSMTSLPKRVLYASMGLAGVVAAACVLDFVGGWTFEGHWGLDICLLLGAGIVIYLGIEALAEQK